jgi:hypothetical protein
MLSEREFILSWKYLSWSNVIYLVTAAYKLVLLISSGPFA